MSRLKPLFLPFLMTLVGLTILIGLGTWQLQRREWKLGLIERIEARARNEPISLSMAKRLWEKDGDVEYYRVLLVGRFLHPLERHLYGLSESQAGWRILTPLETAGGDIVFVDRGIVPDEFKDPASRKDGQVEGVVELVGLARAPESHGAFTPDNQPGANRWFWRDVSGLIASLPPEKAARAAPFMVEAEKQAVPGGWPLSGVTRLNLPNRHVEYAITWFGLALALLAVFLAYARYRLRETVPGEYHAKIADEGGSV
jgi:surfeit locus 1 family protein